MLRNLVNIIRSFTKSQVSLVYDRLSVATSGPAKPPAACARLCKSSFGSDQTGCYIIRSCLSVRGQRLAPLSNLNFPLGH